MEPPEQELNGLAFIAVATQLVFIYLAPLSHSIHMLSKKCIKLILPNETALHGLSISYHHNEGTIMVRAERFSCDC